MTTIELEKLFVKYICHVGCAEGISFATNIKLSPGDMGNLEFTDDDIVSLNDIFEMAKQEYIKIG